MSLRLYNAVRVEGITGASHPRPRADILRGGLFAQDLWKLCEIVRQVSSPTSDGQAVRQGRLSSAEGGACPSYEFSEDLTRAKRLVNTLSPTAQWDLSVTWSR